MTDDRWGRLEEIVRRVVREEIAALGKAKTKLEFINGKWVGMTEAQMEAWRAAFPAMDVDAELKKAAAWCVSNPVLAPKSQFGRFINAWLSKGQNQASLRSIPLQQNKPSPMAIPPSLCEYCLRGAVGSVNGIRHCRDHGLDAMDMKPRPKMPGVVAKAVAGSD